jgi:bifunctional UDP-N-acetylglucosamine pyrophosphorylase/glucosamine-1-phosphate N-acetyltransferase
MKAVILAAGKSTRTYPLTIDRPKVLLKIAGKSLLKHRLDSITGLVDEAILIVGFGKDMIEQSLGKEYQGIRLTYAHQKELLGTGHALLSAEPHLRDEQFLVISGDDIYSRENIRALLKETPSLLAQEVEDPSAFGIWIEKDGFVAGFQEKPESPKSRLANCGLYVLDTGIFPHIKNLKKTSRGEYELNEAVFNYSKQTPVKIFASKEGWIPVGYPWHILTANKYLLDGIEPRIEGEVDDKATLVGKVSIGKGTRILPGAYIEGPCHIGEDCLIGPNCHIRPYTSIGDGCKVGNASEVKGSVIGDGSKIPHLGFVGDSVLGNGVNFSCGCITANLRHDRSKVRTMVKGRLMDTGQRKFGTVIGDNAKLGVRTIIYPGRKIWPGKTTLPGQVVDRDIQD